MLLLSEPEVIVLMSSKAEHLNYLDSEAYIRDVLSWRPPLPVGQLEISHIFSEGKTLSSRGPGYAWESLPRWVAETKEAFRNTGDVPILSVDVCSSLPLFAQLQRAGEFGRSGDRARELTRSMFSTENIHRLANVNPELIALGKAISNDNRIRALIAAATQETLYCLSSEDVRTDQPSRTVFQQMIAQKIAAQNCVYEEDKNGSDIEVGWGYRFKASLSEEPSIALIADLPVPTADAIVARRRLAKGFGPILMNRDLAGLRQQDIQTAKLTQPAGGKMACQYIDWQASYLAEVIIDQTRYRPARFFSIDIADPNEIALSSWVDTPSTTKAMNLYSHAVASLFEPRQHIVANMLAPLPFPDNSVALFTFIDGWPHDFPALGRGEISLRQFKLDATNILQSYYKKLAYGGKIVIFPWLLPNGGQAEDYTLRLVEAAFSEWSHQGVGKKLYGQKTLAEYMSSSDAEINERGLSSIVFSDSPFYEALIIDKPHRTSLINRQKQMMGQSAISGAQNQD